MIFALLLTAMPVWAQIMSVDVSEQATMIERVLKYDRALNDRAGDTIDILFLNFPGDATISDADATTMMDALDVLAGKSINGRTVQTHRLNWTNQADLSAFAKANSIEVVYLLPADKSNIRPVTTLATEIKTVTICGMIPYLTEYVSIAIAKAGPMTKVFLNPTQSKSEGADFSADLMKISQIIKPG